MARPERIYLDYAATAPLRPAAREAMFAALAAGGNASSVHTEGRAAKQRIEEAREEVARLAGARPAQVVFTSGATEANNWVLAGLWKRRLVSTVEHASVLAPAERHGAALLPVDGDGLIRVDAAQGETGTLVSVQMANNETGVLQPVEDIAARVMEAGGVFHCDAVQAAGARALDFRSSGFAFMSLSAHKIGGPQGVGALVMRDEGRLPPLLLGGGQEKRKRAGTEAMALIAGFGAAAQAAMAERESFAKRVEDWRGRFEARLRSALPGLVVYGEGAPRLPHISCFGLPGLSAEALVIAADLAGFAISAGSACSSGKVTPSHVLAAMGCSEEEARGAVRVSFGWNTDEMDLTRFADAFIAQAQHMTGAPPTAAPLAEMRV